MYPYLVALASNNAPGIAPRRAKAALSRVPIEGFTVADVIFGNGANASKFTVTDVWGTS